MKKTLALLIALMLVFGMTATAFAYATANGANVQTAVQTAVITDNDVAAIGGDVGNVTVVAFQANDLGYKPINFGSQTNKVWAKGGGNISTGGNTIKQKIDQKIINCCPKKPFKKLPPSSNFD